MAESKPSGLQKLFSILGNISDPLNKREQARIANDQARENLRVSRRTNDAVAQLPSLLTPTPDDSPALAVNPLTGEPLSAPDIGNLPEAERQRKAAIPGVLSQIAPQTVADSILNPRSPGSFEQTAQSVELRLNRNLTPDEVLSMASRGGGTAAELLATLNIRKLIGDIEGEELTRAQEKETGDNAIVDSLDGILRLNEANTKLDDTILRTGGSFMDFKRQGMSFVADVASLAGQDRFAAELNNTVTEFDKLTKETAKFSGDIIKVLNSSGIGSTRALQGLVERQSASEKVSPGANRSIMRVALRELLRAADSRNVNLVDRDQYEALLTDGTPLQFFTEQEVIEAAVVGSIRPGDTIFIDGVEDVFEGLE